MSEIQPGPVNETTTSPEHETREGMSPGDARVALATIDRNYLSSEAQSVSDEHKAALKDLSLESSQPIIDAINDISLEAASDLSNKEWNNDTWARIQRMTAEDVDPTLRQQRIDAFAQIGIKHDGTDVNAKGLHESVENFRHKYADYDSRNIIGFVTDISTDLKDDKGTIDPQALEKRLQAISPFLGAFGGDDEEQLVFKTAHLYALTTQEEAKKEQFADKIVTAAEQVLPEEDKSWMQKLRTKLDENAQPKPPEPINPPPPEPDKDKTATKKVPLIGRRVITEDGKATYTVLEEKDGKVTKIISDDGVEIAGGLIDDIIKKGNPDIVQKDMTVIRTRSSGDNEEYRVDSVYVAKTPDGKDVIRVKLESKKSGARRTELLSDFRTMLTTEKSGWALPDTPSETKTDETVKPIDESPSKAEREQVTLTDSAHIVDEIRSAFATTGRDKLTFESAPDVLLPFIEQQIADQAKILSPLQAKMQDKPDGPGKQMMLSGSIKKLTVTVDFNVKLENSDAGLVIVRQPDDIQARGLGSGKAESLITEKIGQIDALLKQQINKKLEGVGKVNKIQLGENGLICEMTRG